MHGGEADHLGDVRKILRQNPKGLSISEISRKAHLNRNSVAKYLQVLLASGQAEARTIGTARVYAPSRRLPVSAMLEYSNDLIAVLNRDGVVIHINTPLLEFSGLTREEVLGAAILDADLPLLSAPALRPFLADPPLEEIVVPEIEWENGMVFRAKILPTNFEDGGHGTTVVLENITEEKKAWRTRSLLASIVESTDDAVIGKNLEGMVISWNRAAERLYGYTKAEMIGQPLDRIVPRDHVREMAAIMAAIAEGRGIKRIETVRIRKGGEPVDVALTISPIRGEDGAVIGASTIARDITALKKAEAEKELHLKNMAFLSGTATDLVGMKDDEICGYVVRKIQELVPDAIVVIASYNPVNDMLTAEEVAASPHDVEVLARYLGEHPIGFAIPVPDGYRDKLHEHGLVPGPSFYAMMMKKVPEERCRRIEGDLDLNGSLYAPIISEGRFLGNVVIIMKKGTVVEDHALIETFIDQAAVAIQRRVTFRALQRSRKQAKDLLNATHDLAVLISADGEVLDLNQGAVRFLGRSEEDLIGRSIREIVPPELAVQQEVCAAVHGETGSMSCFEVTLSEGTFDVSVTSIADENSPFHKFAIFLRDITAERAAEDRIREMNRRLTDIIEFLPDPTFVIDGDGIVTAWNRAMEVVTGVPKEEMIGKGDYAYAVPFYGEERQILIDLIDVPDEVLPPYLHVDRALHEIVGSAFCPSVADGEGAYLWGKATALFDENGTRIGAIESIRDVTPLVHAESALKESEAKYRDLVENANSVILSLDTEGRITFFNRFAESFFGYTRDEVLGRSILGLIVPEIDSTGRDLRFMVSALCTHPDRFENVENENIARDGSTLWVTWTNRAIYDSNGKVVGVTCVGNDITARKMMEEKLKAAQQNLETTVRCQTADLIFSNESLRREIGERVAAQDALEKNRNALRLILEVIADCIFVVGRDGGVRSVSTPGEALRGVPVDAYLPGVLPEERIREVFAGGRPIRQEVRLVSFGREIALDTWLVPVVDWDGKGPAIVGVARERALN